MTVVGKKLRSRSNESYYVTIGRPNYEEREYIKAFHPEGKWSPVRKLQLTYPPKRRKG